MPTTEADIQRMRNAKKASVALDGNADVDETRMAVKYGQKRKTLKEIMDYALDFVQPPRGR